MFEKVILEQNRHWQGKSLETGIARQALQRVIPLLPGKQIIIITGLRRCGKSYLLRQILTFLIQQKHPAKNILLLNLENPYFDEIKDKVISLEQIFEEYLALRESSGKTSILFDEVQFFRHWQVFVKSKYETEQVKFILTGSNSWLLSSEFTTLLSGRSFNIELYPFSFKEFLEAKKVTVQSKMDLFSREKELQKMFDEYVEWGGFPEVVLCNSIEEKKELLGTYYKNIVFQDVIPRFKISNFKETQELAHYLLTNVGKLFSYNKLSPLLGLSDKTIKEYTHYFEQAYLLFEVSKYSPSLKKQLTYLKKVYSGDVGLSNAVDFHISADRGRVLENVVFLELKRRRKEIYYHQERYECDFLIKESKKITLAIQVCQILTEENRQREISGLLEALKKYKVKEGLILTEKQEEIIKKGNFNIRIIPIWKWLLENNKT